MDAWETVTAMRIPSVRRARCGERLCVPVHLRFDLHHAEPSSLLDRQGHERIVALPGDGAEDGIAVFVLRGHAAPQDDGFDPRRYKVDACLGGEIVWIFFSVEIVVPAGSDALFVGDCLERTTVGLHELTAALEALVEEGISAETLCAGEGHLIDHVLRGARLSDENGNCICTTRLTTVLVKIGVPVRRVTAWHRMNSQLKASSWGLIVLQEWDSSSTPKLYSKLNKHSFLPPLGSKVCLNGGGAGISLTTVL